MGSRRTHDDRLARLREAGLTEDELARLHAPIGLDLGARTPEETAVSIAAEIIAPRWGGTGAQLRRDRRADPPRAAARPALTVRNARYAATYAASLIDRSQRDSVRSAFRPRGVEVAMTKINVTVDGVAYADEVEPRTLLVHYLREQLGKVGTVVGCDTSNCGACTVRPRRPAA